MHLSHQYHWDYDLSATTCPHSGDSLFFFTQKTTVCQSSKSYAQELDWLSMLSVHLGPKDGMALHFCLTYCVCQDDFNYLRIKSIIFKFKLQHNHRNPFICVHSGLEWQETGIPKAFRIYCWTLLFCFPSLLIKWEESMCRNAESTEEKVFHMEWSIMSASNLFVSVIIGEDYHFNGDHLSTPQSKESHEIRHVS